MDGKKAPAKALRAVAILAAAGLAALFLFLFFRGDYSLNRTVRECRLRLLQIEHLSATMDTDFRFIFQEDRCLIDRWDEGGGNWVRHGESKYRDSVRNISGETELLMTNGKLVAGRPESRKTAIRKYVTVEFSRPGSSRKPGFIFFDSGMWHVRD